MHGGPFANIAHGCNSVIATKTALKLADVVVTEAGFGADLGAEKFLDIKCRAAGLKPNYVVVVATIRALKMHGGVNKKELDQENVEALIKGFENLQKHIENVTQYKLPYVVAINRFIQDTDAEVAALRKLCEERNHPVCLNTVFTDGGNGGLELADYLIDHLKDDNDFEFIYDLNDTLENKIETICKKIYGAKDVVYEEEAVKTLNKLKEIGFSNAYICMAKTPNSLSDKDELIGRPEGFTITVKEVRVSAGVNFVVVLTGKVMTMPGLPKTPAANRMNIDKNGIIEWLF
jgi:formate--tetrahydrofolate ligase